MLFNSLEFLIFLPIALAINFALPARHRWIFLLVASWYFYCCWKISYAFLLLASTLTDYACARLIERAATPAIKRRYLFASLALNLGLLFTFKYFDFLNGSLRALAHALGLPYGVADLNLTLPVGISFYTFQSLGYIIDVYRGQVAAERNLFRFALYVAYFPQLVAGPIERARNLMPQLRQTFAFDYERTRDGLALILWGLIKKLVIADRVCEYVDTVFAQPALHHGLQVWLADFLFVIQLYCDFSGYSDIAVGCAGILGVKLMLNFRQPLLARNIAELWGRWHISLTTWFRDYLFVYVGGRSRNRARMLTGIVLVFLVNGMWHGANWTFFIFGLLHGLALAGYYVVLPGIKRLYQAVGLAAHPRLSFAVSNMAGMFVFMFVGNFFRGASVSDAAQLCANMFRPAGPDAPLNLFRHPVDFWISLACVLLLYYSEHIGKHQGYGAWLAARSVPVRWLLLLAGLASIILFGKWDAMSFIYFQF